jgi:hypothetical protein
MHCWITPNGQKIVAQSFTGLIAKYWWSKLKSQHLKLNTMPKNGLLSDQDIEKQLFIGGSDSLPQLLQNKKLKA